MCSKYFVVCRLSDWKGVSIVAAMGQYVEGFCLFAMQQQMLWTPKLPKHTIRIGKSSKLFVYT